MALYIALTKWKYRGIQSVSIELLKYPIDLDMNLFGG
jgi:hypothetical protein